MARRATKSLPAPLAPITWRDGVHLTGTPIWCDARRRRDICFVSSVERVGRSGHGQLIGTPLTLALLAAGDDGQLAVPLRQRFTLGTVRLELIPSGRGVGAAALFADIAGKRVLYANTVRTTSGGAGEAAEVRTCDALVVGAPYGEPHHVFPPLTRVIDQTIAWVRTQVATGRRPVLFVDGLLDGIEVATKLSEQGIAIAGTRVLKEAATRLATSARGANDVTRAVPVIGSVSPRKTDAAVIWFDTDHAGLAKAIGKTSFATALVSARAVESAAGYDAAFAWATAADRKQLLAWIESASARHVFVTGACADSIAAAVGPHARVIGPPQQMALFG